MSVLIANQKQKITTFEGLISPLGFDKFVNEYLEKEHLVISRANPDFYQTLFSISQVDYILDVNRPRDSSIRVVKNQVPLLPTKYQNPDGSLNLNHIYAAYADGHTVVINEIERFWHPLKTLCQNISTQLSYHSVANMYLTPKNESALLPHYDSHDVYVLQVHGKKHWRIYDSPVETPLLHSHQPVFQPQELSNMREITLHAGDLMYMPRGLPHNAYTTDESSLHITIGVYPSQWVDLLTKSIQHLAITDASFRKALPAGYLKQESWNEAFYQEFSAKFQELMQKLTESNKMMEGMNLLAEEQRSKYAPKGDGHFRMLDQMDELHLDNWLQQRTGITSSVQITGNSCRIIYPGNVIKGPSHIAAALQFISKTEGAFRLGDLPAISDDNKIKLAARLIRGGLLKIV